MAVFEETYQGLIRDIMRNGVPEKHARTGHETRSIPGKSFSIDIERDGFPLLALRRIPIKIFIAEQIWFISGARRPEDFLRDYTKIWDAFTNPNDVVTVAYGYRWRKHFGRDQLAMLIKLLEDEPSSRHGVVLTWDPSGDGLGGTQKSNVPCPYTFTVNIIGGRLHLHNIVRSNDAVLGLPHDVAGFALLQCMLAQRLGVQTGVYTHSISNAHIYDNQYEAVEEMLKRPTNTTPLRLELPGNSFNRAEQRDTVLVDDIFHNLSGQYAPHEPISGLKVIL